MAVSFSGYKIILLSLTYYLVGCQTHTTPLQLQSPQAVQHAVDGRRKLESEVEQILYLAQSQQISSAIQRYFSYRNQRGTHDFALLQKIGLLQLRPLPWKAAAQLQIANLYGAMLTQHTAFLPLFAAALQHPHPAVQLVAVDCLARMQQAEADQLLQQAMASDYLDVVLAAAQHLAQQHKANALEQIRALFEKVDSSQRPLFPAFFAALGTPAAVKLLRQTLCDKDINVILQAIIAAGQTGCDELALEILDLLNSPDLQLQEACIQALTLFLDQRAVEPLQKLTASKDGAVQVSACLGLYRLGQWTQKNVLEKQALATKNVFAIYALGQIAQTQPVLTQLLQASDPHVRLNAAMALLQQQDPACVEVLLPLLLADQTDLALEQRCSAGGGLIAWKAWPAANLWVQKKPWLHEQSLRLREDVLQQMGNLPECAFIAVATALFDSEQNDLIPMLIQQLEQLHTPAVVEILEQYQQKLGSPLIRYYCTLALFHLQPNKNDGRSLINWVEQQMQTQIIQFRPFITEKNFNKTAALTPEEHSRLLITILETLAQEKQTIGIDLLLWALGEGHFDNRPILAGLLLNSCQ